MLYLIFTNIDFRIYFTLSPRKPDLWQITNDKQSPIPLIRISFIVMGLNAFRWSNIHIRSTQMHLIENTEKSTSSTLFHFTWRVCLVDARNPIRKSEPVLTLHTSTNPIGPAHNPVGFNCFPWWFRWVNVRGSWMCVCDACYLSDECARTIFMELYGHNACKFAIGISPNSACPAATVCIRSWSMCLLVALFGMFSRFKVKRICFCLVHIVKRIYDCSFVCYATFACCSRRGHRLCFHKHVRQLTQIFTPSGSSQINVGWWVVDAICNGNGPHKFVVLSTFRQSIITANTKTRFSAAAKLVFVTHLLKGFSLWHCEKVKSGQPTGMNNE